jgi:hypothetical protein
MLLEVVVALCKRSTTSRLQRVTHPYDPGVAVRIIC